MNNLEDIILEKYCDGVIDDEHFISLYEAANDEIKRIKQKIKNKEELTDEEKEKYKKYKKKRNIKIAVGAGVGAITAATIAKRYSDTKVSNRQKSNDTKLNDNPPLSFSGKNEDERPFKYGYSNISEIKNDLARYKKQYDKLNDDIDKTEAVIRDSKKEREEIERSYSKMGWDTSTVLKNFDASTEIERDVLKSYNDCKVKVQREIDRLEDLLDEIERGL